VNTQLETQSDGGVALIVAVLIMLLLAALGLSLTMVTSTEERVAYSYANAGEAFYAAEAALELAVQELALIPDWSHALDGSATSSFVDRQVSSRPWPGGVAQTSREATALVTCGRTSCTGVDMDARTAERPWGPNNPRWQLYAYGPMRNISPSNVDSLHYVAVWVGDDAMENDGNPLVDGDETAGPNPGRDVLTLLAHGYGPASIRKVEATVARADGRVRVLSWRELR
jgi:hypothetical protein